MISSPVKMQDIAKRAQVSQSTVSCVLNGRRKGVWIGEDTRSRVLAAAAELGYQPNDLARAVVTGKSRMLGLLGFNSRFESAARMLDSALAEAEASGYTIKVLHAPEGPLSATTIDQCVRSRLAGIMLLFPGEQDLSSLREEAARYRMQVVVVDNSRPNTWGTRVVSDDSGGARLAVDHLVSLGHERIAFLGGDPALPMVQEREVGYRAAMAIHSLPITEDSVAGARWVTEAIEQAVDRIVNSSPHPATGIVCSADEVALVVIRYLRSIGRDVPRDVSVVGYANLTMCELADPPLTTVAQPFEEMGRRAVQHLIQRVESAVDQFDDSPVRETIANRLVVRKSTGPAPGIQIL